ncbi:DegT/DnrJ/EryC1/StrS family aminotransferase [Candidatus Pelagibacter sp.]|nr:DegT/DnrJ/EryC1/StrS family aminotransferase [Candidatus Pelagibacter sp.]
MKSNNIFVWSYLKDYKKERKKILSLVDKVFKSGSLVLSKEVSNFENNFSKFTNNKYGVGVNSGTDALRIALMAAGIKKDDEIITVSNTAVPTVCAIVECGAKPIFVDINEKDFLIDVSKIEEKINKKTKAIIPVNLYGQSADYEKINKIAKKFNLKVIEDCAQSAGSFYKGKPSGSHGDLAAFSFYPTKILGAYGDGGMVVTKNKNYFIKAKKLRKYGMSKLYYSEFHGVNSRLDEVQAAILNYQLGKLTQKIIKRRRIAKIYDENINNDKLIKPIESKNNYHGYYIYVVRHPQRNKFMSYLRKNNIFCNISYPFPVHSMKGYRHLHNRNEKLKITDKLSKQIFSLPMYPELEMSEVEKVIKVINNF